ncbi:hypothetical protein ILUMI_05468, partial [Ignelater luminosus]
MYLHAGQGESVRSISSPSNPPDDHDSNYTLTNGDEHHIEHTHSSENNTNNDTINGNCASHINRCSILSDDNSERCDSDYNASAESNASSRRVSIESRNSEEECEECLRRRRYALSPLLSVAECRNELFISLRRDE